jgi:hypothetical protein
VTKKWIAVVIGVGVIGATGSLAFVAGQMVSPSQRAAMASEPPVTEATGTVEERVVAGRQVGRASVVFPSPKTVVIPYDDAGDVVTHTYLKPGKTVKAGSVLIEVAGHPVLALPAPFSPYRTLTPGVSGRDVTVLRAALKEMGLSVSSSSSSALSTWELSGLDRQIHSLGYSLPLADDVKEADAPETQDTPKDVKKVLSLPASWWVGIRHLPARVASKGPSVGAHVDTTNAVLSLSTGAPILKATMPTVSGGVTTGMALTFSPDAEVSHEWTVKKATVSASDQSSLTSEVMITTKEAIPASMANATGKLVIGATDQQRELAVPLTAITSGTDGNPVVRVQMDDGKIKLVTVNEGDQADGWVAVTPMSESLPIGSAVVLG